MASAAAAVGSSPVNRRMSNLEESRRLQDMALAPLGLSRFKIPEDGNCMFRAVSAQLGLEQGKYHSVLRQAAAAWMGQHTQYLLEAGLMDGPAEVAETAVEGSWPGQAALAALASLLQVNIAVVQGGDQGSIDIQHVAPYQGTAPAEGVILAYLYLGHYDALLQQPGTPNPDYAEWSAACHRNLTLSQQLANKLSLEEESSKVSSLQIDLRPPPAPRQRRPSIDNVKSEMIHPDGARHKLLRPSTSMGPTYGRQNSDQGPTRRSQSEARAVSLERERRRSSPGPGKSSPYDGIRAAIQKERRRSSSRTQDPPSPSPSQAYNYDGSIRSASSPIQYVIKRSEPRSPRHRDSPERPHLKSVKQISLHKDFERERERDDTLRNSLKERRSSEGANIKKKPEVILARPSFGLDFGSKRPIRQIPITHERMNGETRPTGSQSRKVPPKTAPKPQVNKYTGGGSISGMENFEKHPTDDRHEQKVTIIPIRIRHSSSEKSEHSPISPNSRDKSRGSRTRARSRESDNIPGFTKTRVRSRERRRSIDRPQTGFKPAGSQPRSTPIDTANVVMTPTEPDKSKENQRMPYVGLSPSETRKVSVQVSTDEMGRPSARRRRPIQQQVEVPVPGSPGICRVLPPSSSRNQGIEIPLRPSTSSSSEPKQKSQLDIQPLQTPLSDPPVRRRSVIEIPPLGVNMSSMKRSDSKNLHIQQQRHHQPQRSTLL